MPGRGRGKPKSKDVNISDEDLAKIFNSKSDINDATPSGLAASGQTVTSTDKERFEDSHETTPTGTEEIKKVQVAETVCKNGNDIPGDTKSAEYNGTHLPGRSQSDSATFKSKLNPESTEFIPRSIQQSSLNVKAPVFVPRFIQPDTGPLQDVGGPDDPLTVSDILQGFSRVTKGDNPLLTSTATMLLEATMFPATFDSHLSILTHLIRGSKPSEEVVCDLAEMLLKWGINNSGLRYTAIKIADYYCQLETKEVFRPKLFTKLQKIYENQLQCKHESEEEISFLIELSLFMAEMLYRVRLCNNVVIWVLAKALFELMFILLEIKSDESIIQTCSILKLCGHLLEDSKAIDAIPKEANFVPKNKMEVLLSTLRQLAVDESLSDRTVNVVLNTLQYRGSGYGRYDDISECSGMPVENPVQNLEEWADYVDEDGNIIEGEDDVHPAIDLNDQQDPNIDDELLKEYEEFVQEFEEHLLMQEFGQQY